jgi:hypothetical protein
MNKYAVMDKIKNKITYTYNYHRMKSINLKSTEVQFQMLESNGQYWDDEKAYTWTGSNIQYDIGYVPFDPTSKYCKIYRYIPNANKHYNLNEAPVEHDYKTGLSTNLFPKRFFNKGELYKTEWYADEEFTDLIINVDIVYTRDHIGFPLYRNTTRTWYMENGDPHPTTKITKKIYSNDLTDQINEGIKRRQNLYNGIQMPIVGMMMGSMPPLEGESVKDWQERVLRIGRNFLAQYKEQFTAFIEESNAVIYKVLEESQEKWLDFPNGYGGTIREYILNQFDYLGTFGY